MCSPWEGERGLCAEGAVGVPEGGVPEGMGSVPESIGAGSFTCHRSEASLTQAALMTGKRRPLFINESMQRLTTEIPLDRATAYRGDD